MNSFINKRFAKTLIPHSRLAFAQIAVAIAAISVIALGCDVHGISAPGSISTLTVSPNPQSLAVGGTQQFVATGADFSGAAITLTPVWSVVAGGGSISSTGVFTAGTTTGTFASTVMATSGSLSSVATVVVTAGPLATITVTPPTVSLAIGATQQYTAVGKDASGNVVAITPSWSVVAGGGTILPSGVFTAGTAAGTYPATVRASVGTLAGFADVTVNAGALATVTVTPNPDTLSGLATQQFTQVGRDANGNVIAGAAVWSVVNGGGTISPTGLFTAFAAPGTFTGTVQAARGAISGVATVVVRPTLTSITVTPNPDSLQANGTQQFSAVGRDANGAIFPITPVWSVNNGGGSINAVTGLFTAGALTGTYVNTVTATSGSVAGSATVTVTPVITTITVTPNPDTLQANTTQQFTAVARDANGVIQPSAFTWSVVNGGGSINPNTGLFTAGLNAGTFVNTIKATSGTTSGLATVTVTPLGAAPLINLRTAAVNGIMAGQAFTCVNLGVINADIAISPGSTVTGFPPCVITGVQHLAPDPVAAQMQNDLTSAYNTLFGLPCPPANAIVANLGGTTKPAGVYCSATGVGVTGVLTLDGGGDPNATFVIQVGTALTTAGDVVLINQAQAKNVYWVVGSSATIGTASQWKGNVITLTSITLVDNANLIGRALARNGSVSLGTGNTVTLP